MQIDCLIRVQFDHCKAEFLHPSKTLNKILNPNNDCSDNDEIHI
jgi:hypothetical protein